MNKIRHATDKDILKIGKFYDEKNNIEKKVRSIFFQEVLKKNKYVFRILDTHEGIKGLHSLYPLSHGIYEGVLKGSVKHSELPNFLLSYRNKEIFLYLDLDVLEHNNEQEVDYLKELTEDIRKKLIILSKERINILELGVLITDKKKEKLFCEMGFRKTYTFERDGEVHSVFRASVLDVILSEKLF